MFSSVYVCAPCAFLVFQRPEKGVKSLGARVVGSCRLPYFRPLLSDVVVSKPCVAVEHWEENLKESMRISKS